MKMAVSLRLVGPGNYHQSYIEHCSERYLVVRDYQISCEPLKKDVDNFKYRLATYPALYEKESMVIAQTVSCQHHSERGLRVYLCAKDENNISFQEMDLPDSPQPMPTDDLIFFISHGLQSGFVCFESSKYPMRFLAVDEDRVCLKQLNDYSAAYETRMVQFKVNFIH